MIAVAEVIPLADALIIERTILIRREAKIKLPDAVIAATALVRGLTVVSRNEKDFSRIAGLTYLNPHRM
ncbi:MAG: PIN domain-containing protein [Bacteroidetes bacterium]|nr:PIN domain-containing protein [Fibrella sp.]